MLSSFRSIRLVLSRRSLPPATFRRTAQYNQGIYACNTENPNESAYFRMGLFGFAFLASCSLAKDIFAVESKTDAPLYTSRDLSKPLVNQAEYRVFCGSSHRLLGEKVSQVLERPLGKINVGKYSDGETSVQIEESVRLMPIFMIQSTMTNDSLIELLLTISCMRRASAGKIHVIIPYFGYARQDQRHLPSREPIAAADVARLFQEVGADHVIGIDLHSGQIEGFFHVPVENLNAWSIASNYFGVLFSSSKMMVEQGKKKRKITVVAAHENQAIRATEFKRLLAKRLPQYDLNFALIARSKDHGQEPSLIGSIQDCDVIIIDDIVNTGSTIASDVAVIKAQGGNHIYAFATHACFRPETQTIIEGIADLDFLLITDTLPVSPHVLQSPKIRQISIAPLLARVINGIIKGESVKDLFTN